MPSITVSPFAPARAAEWDRFVLRSMNGTMFHLQQFLAYHPEGKFNFHHLMFEREGQLIAVLPGGINREGGYESPVGASYGGLVTGDISFADALDLVDALEAYARAQGWTDVQLTHAPVVYTRTLSQNVDYALLWRGFTYDCHYISHIVDLRELPEDVLTVFDKTSRKTLHRRDRELATRTEINTDYDAFYPILLANKARHNVRPTHSREDLGRLLELMPERLVLFMDYEGDVPIGGSLNFVANERVLLCFYQMLDYAYEHRRPIYSLAYEVIRWAKQNGYTYFDFGVSQDTADPNPMAPAMSLIAFKERFAARGLMRSTLRKKC
jgi:CelD/BcsL family acetyltransferase involved in cellulose biosynthesis